MTAVQGITPRDVLDFWFKETPKKRWFSADPAFDALVRSRFEPAWEAARLGHYDDDDWASSKDGALALIVLFDQFPRNMFRGTAKAFATDGLARKVADIAILRGFDLEAEPDERSFFYLPFMHSERLADQEKCVRLTEERLGATHYTLPHAVSHRNAIARFGRFPARNVALNRASTPDEIAFLQQNPTGF